MNNQWMDHPVLNNISEEKMNILSHIINGAKGMEPKQMLTYFIQQSGQAASQGITFSDEETNLILDVITTDMSQADKKRVQTIQRMVQMMSKRNKTREN
ncbi:MAG: hypothetical protein K6G64_03900 [Eubacterium sp.]|nr:hypothetical protein [Eubacterium sp.]